MPTQTFFHLPKEKQKRLIEAARIEFSRVPLKEASIANIVKLADIPRGSFDQYLEVTVHHHFYYFATMRPYNYKMIYEILEGENASFYRNLFMNMDYRASRKVAPHTSRQKTPHDPHKEHKQDAKELLELIDRTKLKVKNDHELELLIQLVMNTVFTTIAHSYRLFSTSEDYSVEQAISEFNLKLSWLKNGVYK